MFQCPNEICKQKYATERGLQMHFKKSTACTMVFAKVIEGKTISSPATTTKQQVNNIQESYIRWLRNQQTQITTNEQDEEVISINNQAMDDDIFESEDESVNSDMETDSDEVSNFTDCQWIQTKLLKILNDAKAPLYLFEDIMKWAQEASQLGINFDKIIVNRSSMIHHLEKHLKMQ